jgi:transcriptional regulator with XRE-family HTH domain
MGDPLITYTANGTPAIRQRLVGAALRRYREAMGFRLEDAADVLECDRSKLSRIETGQRGIRSKELRELLAEYGAGEREQTMLIALANPKRASGWWQDYGDALAGDERDMAILESLAAHVCIYHAQQVPALLQTEEYAHAVAAASGFPNGPRAVDALLARQEAVRAAKEPEVAVVITEGALRQQVGSPEVMRDQLARLAGASGTGSQVTVQVLAFSCGAYPAFEAGGLTVMRFAEIPDLGVVHIPGACGGICLGGPEDVLCHAAVFERIRAVALSVPDSAALLRRMAAW